MRNVAINAKGGPQHVDDIAHKWVNPFIGGGTFNA